MKKIAILGGTFSPIHSGHISMANAALAYGMDEVWFMPSGVSYLKEGTGVLPSEIRLEMTKLGIEGETRFKISTIEVEREGNTYTYETMEQLNALYPEYAFYFMLGEDSVYSIESWLYPERIFRACELLAVTRDNTDQWTLREKMTDLKSRFGAKIHLVPMKNVDVSSTEIRKFYAAGGQHHPDVPKEVEAYILKNRIYASDGK